MTFVRSLPLKARSFFIAVIFVSSVIVVIGAWLLGSWVEQWLAVDRCLDGGGRWNYETKACETCPTPPPQ